MSSALGRFCPTPTSANTFCFSHVGATCFRAQRTGVERGYLPRGGPGISPQACARDPPVRRGPRVRGCGRRGRAGRRGCRDRLDRLASLATGGGTGGGATGSDYPGGGGMRPGARCPTRPRPGERREALRRAGAICSLGLSGGSVLAPRGWRWSQRRRGQPAAGDAASGRWPAGRGRRRRGARIPGLRARSTAPPHPASPSCAPGRGCGTMAAPSPPAPACPPSRPRGAPRPLRLPARRRRGERREGARSLLAAADQRRGDCAGRVWSRRAPWTPGGSAAGRANGTSRCRGCCFLAAPGACLRGKGSSLSFSVTPTSFGLYIMR